MKYIYYPEYELEYRGLIDKQNRPNHILNIRLLMFLCDHVILPPSHLLRTSTTNILALINNLQSFFEAGKIVTTQYQSGIDNYFTSRIERVNDPVQKLAMITRVEQIKSGLFFNSSVEHNQSNESVQLSLFDTRVKELITDSNIYRRESLLILNRMDSVSNRTGMPIYSNQLEDVLRELSNNSAITKQQDRYFSKLMSNAYYFSGTYTMNTLVSYNKYFEKINLQSSLLSAYGNAANLIVDPHFLQKLFRALGINVQDIGRLKVSDYKEIMVHPYWENFLRVFDVLYTNAQELEELLKSKEVLARVYWKKRDTISKILSFALDFLIDALLSQIPLIGAMLSFVVSALKQFLPPVEKAEAGATNYACDKIMGLLGKNQDPLLEFSYRLNAVVNELRTEE